MATETKFNIRNPSVKRIMQEIRDLAKTGGLDQEFHAIPLQDDIVSFPHPLPYFLTFSPLLTL